MAVTQGAPKYNAVPTYPCGSALPDAAQALPSPELCPCLSPAHLPPSPPLPPHLQPALQPVHALLRARHVRDGGPAEAAVAKGHVAAAQQHKQHDAQGPQVGCSGWVGRGERGSGGWGWSLVVVRLGGLNGGAKGRCGGWGGPDTGVKGHCRGAGAARSCSNMQRTDRPCIVLGFSTH